MTNRIRIAAAATERAAARSRHDRATGVASINATALTAGVQGGTIQWQNSI
jgi:hypothetical protein